MNYEELEEKQRKEQERCLKAILTSSARKKIIVSGPGTGKTYIFSPLLKGKQGDCLALTFINNLADKLRECLGDLAKSCTFHSFCKGLCHNVDHKDIKYDFTLFPKLELIIKSDAKLILDKNPNFFRSFTQLDLKNKNIEFFLKCSSYYNTVSFDDSVYRVLDYFGKNPDKIPKFEQIVVDEYQDFNKLEVEFIDILGTKSPILIVGDDDQALYGQLRYASARYIREKFKDPEYKAFPLPFCRRCPKVVIDALHDVVSRARSQGKLKERIKKNYICYLPEKLADSKKYPQITHAHCSIQRKSTPYIAKFIEQEIDNLSPEEIKDVNSKGDYTILITGPRQYLKQISSYLEDKEKYVLYFRKIDPELKKISIFEGYKILLTKDKFSNLGWRILLENDPIRNLGPLLKKAIREDIRLYDCLPDAFIKKHEAYLGILENIKNGKDVARDQREILESFLKVKIEDLKVELSQEEIEKEERESASSTTISIVLTTYVGCKGLSAGYVFIVGLNEGNLPRDNTNPSDVEICKFIVALARTIKKCYLISVSRFAGRPEGNRSTFIDWIDKKRIDYKNVNAEYFRIGE